MGANAKERRALEKEREADETTELNEADDDEEGRRSGSQCGVSRESYRKFGRHVVAQRCRASQAL